ncbi:MAG TPA: mitochondrial fission ELM1 family protein [Methyloceanibacter sp.]|nr:mitochondrial fission ELM1 family protein [Methyloceanibacter sp.]
MGNAVQTWIITDGSAGNESQALAVAEAVGLPFALKRVHVTGAMRLIPPQLQIYLPRERLLRSVASSEPLSAPWPRLVISAGRRSAPIALAVKRSSGAFALHILNPKLPARRFDLIAAPAHDDLQAPNVIATAGSVHRVTAARLTEAAKRFEAVIASLPKPRVAVLLGGASRAFSFKPRDAAELGAKLAELARGSGGSLLVTPSRRTPADALAAFSHAVAGVPHTIWDGSGDNPYFGFLALADVIVVTGDSVNMVTEAVGTGKPVFVQALKGRSTRLARFHRLMQERGATRPFAGRLETWTYPAINDTELVASAVRRALGLDPADRSPPSAA